MDSSTDPLASARKEAIRLLCRAQADDALPVDSFERRLEQIRHAPNEATIAAIVADLDGWADGRTGGWEIAGEPAASTNYPAVRSSVHPPIRPADQPFAPAEHLRLASIFGSTTRAGSWTVPLVLETKVLLGEMTLDLRDAVFGADVVDIVVDVTLGSFTLIVPAGTQVENEVEERFSSSSHSTRGAKGAGPNGLLVRLGGQALLASVEIKEKLPSNRTKSGFLDRLLGSG